MTNNIMKRIILTTSLFFCLSITTILAQVVTTNISAPNSSGLSSNSVGDFDVNSDGTILNNSAASGTATLGSTAVAGNGNITAGSEANLILFQVTGTSGSDLDGTIEVFGGEAGLIIANPNGITCDGCAFTNVNRVDLVTGSGYDAGTNTFSTIAATDITVEGNALELSNVDLNIQTGADFINSTTINADNLSIIAGDDFTNSVSIDAETVTIEVTNFDNDIANTGTVSSTNLNIIFTDSLFSSTTTFNGFNFRNLALTTEGFFLSQSVFDLDNLTIKTGALFNNQATIDAASIIVTIGTAFNNSAIINVANFTVVAQYFTNDIVSTINADSFTATVEEKFLNNRESVINADSFTLTAKTFENIGFSTIDAATITIEVPNFASNINNAGTISAASLNFILTDDFTHTSDSFTGFNINNLTVSTDGTFTNANTIDLDGNLTITANSFNNSGGVVISDTFALSVAGDFDYLANYLGTITTNAFNLQVGGDFSYDDSASNFTWRATDTLTVLGHANIVAAGFANSGNITVTNSLNLTANTFANSGGVVSADTFNLDVAGDFEHSGTITTNAYNLNIGGDFSYDDSNNDFTWGDSDTLTVSGSVSVTAAGFENSGNITVTNSGNFTANTFTNTGTVNAATVTIEVPNFADDITNSGTVSSASLNFILTDDFTHSSTSFNGFNNFSNLAITTDGTFTNNATINPTGNLAITAGYTAINQGSIVSGSLDVITADFFRNLTGGDISVANLNIIAGGKVTNTASITVGTLTITANNDSTRTNDTTGFYVSNRGNITATSLNIAAVDNFYNRGNITATTFNITRAKSVFFLNKEIDSFYAAGNDIRWRKYFS